MPKPQNPKTPNPKPQNPKPRGQMTLKPETYIKTHLLDIGGEAEVVFRV